MAFPTFVAAPTTSAGVGTSAAVTTPATNDGELLIILIATDGDNINRRIILLPVLTQNSKV